MFFQQFLPFFFTKFSNHCIILVIVKYLFYSIKLMHIFLILLLIFIGVVILENQLIVYKPKKNIKKIILIIILVLLLSIILFATVTLSSALISIKSKWGKEDYHNLQTVKFTDYPVNK